MGMKTTRNGRSPNGRVSPVLAGLACGLVVGAALGLLLAPQPGRDSRAWIAERARAIVRRRGVRGLVEAMRSGSFEHDAANAPDREAPLS